MKNIAGKELFFFFFLKKVEFCVCVVFTREKVTAVLPQLEGLCVQAPGALVGVGAVPLSHGLHVLSAVRVQKENHGVVLDVVQPLHCSGGDVQQRVLVLGRQDEGQVRWEERAE